MCCKEGGGQGVRRPEGPPEARPQPQQAHRPQAQDRRDHQRWHYVHLCNFCMDIFWLKVSHKLSWQKCTSTGIRSFREVLLRFLENSYYNSFFLHGCTAIVVSAHWPLQLPSNILIKPWNWPNDAPCVLSFCPTFLCGLMLHPTNERNENFPSLSLNGPISILPPLLHLTGGFSNFGLPRRRLPIFIILSHNWTEHHQYRLSLHLLIGLISTLIWVLVVPFQPLAEML